MIPEIFGGDSLQHGRRRRRLGRAVGRADAVFVQARYPAVALSKG